MTSTQRIPSRECKLTLCSLAAFALILNLWSGTVTPVSALPAKFESPFALDTSDAAFDDNSRTFDSVESAIDSYGNPIDTLKPIDTPDGRKVVSAQGLQFEIPNYANGITEIKKPADDLLPPFIVQIDSVDDHGDNYDAKDEANDDNHGTENVDDDNFDDVEYVSENFDSSTAKLFHQHQHSQNANNDSVNDKKKLNDSNESNVNHKHNTALHNSSNNYQHLYYEIIESTTMPSNSQVAHQLENVNDHVALISSSEKNQPLKRSQSTSNHKHLNEASSLAHARNHNKISSHHSHSQLARTIPLSNGNFNYPNVPTDISVINRIAAKYHNPLPTLDPIAVAVPNEADQATTTTVDVENAKIVEVSANKQLTQASAYSPNFISSDKKLPAYLLDLNDPDIAGPVEYMPEDDGGSLKVIAWDLLPPNADTDNSISNSKLGKHNEVNNKKVYQGLQSSFGQPTTAASESVEFTVAGRFGQSSTTAKPSSTSQSHHRGSVHYSTTSTTARTTRTTRPSTTTTTTTTTTRRPTTSTTRYTTTTTTKRPTTTTTIAPLTTTEKLDPSTFYKLEAGDSYTLPSWLAGIDDPDLDVAVTFVVPTDNNEYNHTVDRDLLPPYEPFMDLSNIHLPAPVETVTKPTVTTTTKRPTTTTQRTTISSTRPSWVRANPTTTTQRPSSTVNSRFSFNHIASKHEPAAHTLTSSQSSTQASFSSSVTKTTTTPTPSTTNFNQNSKQKIPNSEHISNNEQATRPQPANPFLPRPFNRNQYDNKAATTATTTTTTTTSTTIAPFFEKNPFAPTIPPWLTDFDYPELGAAVPFVYNPNDLDKDFANDLLPPSNIEAQATDNSKAVFVSSSPSSFNSFHSPQSFTHQQPTRTSAFHTSTTSFPTKVSLPLPSAQNINRNYDTVNQPPGVFVPPVTAENTNVNANDRANTIAENTKKISNKNFAAPFEPTGSEGSSAASTSQEIFPPSASATTPTKTTFSKSDDGKVITNSVFQTGTSAKPFGFGFGSTGSSFGTTQKESSSSQSNQFFAGSSAFSSAGSNAIQSTSTFSNFGSSSSFNKASTPSTFSSFSSTFGSSGSSAGSGKYTGSFGGAPGVLGSGKIGYAVQADGSIRDPDHTFRPPTGTGAAATATTIATTKAPKSVTSAFSQFGSSAFGGTAAAAASNANKYHGNFGGPPGILIPYDNVSGGKL